MMSKRIISKTTFSLSRRKSGKNSQRMVIKILQRDYEADIKKEQLILIFLKEENLIN